MSSYGSNHSGQLHPGYQPQPPQRPRSYSNPPYPVTPGSIAYPPQQQSSYFPPPPPPTAPYPQAPPTSNPIAIPASNRKRASSDYGYGNSTSHPLPMSPYANSYPTQHLQPIPQQQPIPETFQYSPQQQSGMPGPLDHQHHHHHHRRRRSSSSQHAYDPRQSYESAHSYQSAHSQPSPDFYARPLQDNYANHADWHGYGNGRENKGHVHTHAKPLPSKEYGDWDKDEVTKYHKDQNLERRPTLGGSLMSLVKKFGGSERR